MTTADRLLDEGLRGVDWRNPRALVKALAKIGEDVEKRSNEDYTEESDPNYGRVVVAPEVMLERLIGAIQRRIPPPQSPPKGLNAQESVELVRAVLDMVESGQDAYHYYYSEGRIQMLTQRYGLPPEEVFNNGVELTKDYERWLDAKIADQNSDVVHGAVGKGNTIDAAKFVGEMVRRFSAKSRQRARDEMYAAFLTEVAESRVIDRTRVVPVPSSVAITSTVPPLIQGCIASPNIEDPSALGQDEMVASNQISFSFTFGFPNSGEWFK